MMMVTMDTFSVLIVLVVVVVVVVVVCCDCHWICLLLPTLISFHGATALSGTGPPHYRVFTITLRHIKLGRSPLDGWSARHRDLCLATHSTFYRQMSMPPARFESTTTASERPRTHALDRAATGIGAHFNNKQNLIIIIIYYKDQGACIDSGLIVCHHIHTRISSV